MQSVVVIGTGALGKRYIEAVSRIGREFALLLYDASPEALASAERFISENQFELPSSVHAMNSLSQTLAAIGDESVVVVSTTAKGRGTLLQKVIERNPKAIICEKLVTQSLDEYQQLLDVTAGSNVPVFVNFTLRVQSFYEQIKSEIESGTNFLLFANMPRTGLACASIHHIDLFCWLFAIDEYEFIGSHFVETYEQKRAGFEDIVGSMHLKSKNGTALIGNSAVPNFCTMQIVLPDTVYDVFEDQRSVTTVRKQQAPGTVELTRVEYRYVSSYMAGIIASCLDGNYVQARKLPELQEAFLPHKILFGYMHRHSLCGLNIT